MAKRPCCCKEETPQVKHYIAIPCREYEAHLFLTAGVTSVFPQQFDESIEFGQQEPSFPFKVLGIDGTDLIVGRDARRKLKFMLRGAGGGAKLNSFGGNGAYIDFNYIPYQNTNFTNMRIHIGRGGTGPKPGQPLDYSIPTQLYSGAPGYPLASWGGGAAAFAFNPIDITDGIGFIAGAGGGAGTAPDPEEVLSGGDAGVELGAAGSGPEGGGGASTITNSGGVAGGGNAQPGASTRGGRGTRPDPAPELNIPLDQVGGGGGAGYYGGGGGGFESSGGGGSSTLAVNVNQTLIEYDIAFDATELGPGSRCNPYFSKTWDPGLGANNIGRFLETTGNTFIPEYNGTTSQAAVYFRNRWCPCNESQVDFSNDSTGNFPDGLNYICITEEQYQTILTLADELPPPPSTVDDSGVQQSFLSFILNGTRYILVQWSQTTDPRIGHYYCTIGCEPDYMVEGIPESAKWYLPTLNNFRNFSDSRRFFSDLSETYNFSNTTSCCDIFIGKRLCRPPFINCSYTTDELGNPLSGCFCSTNQTPSLYKSICKSSIPDQDVAFIAGDTNSDWIYLCIPAVGWHRFSDTNLEYIVGLYNYFEASTSQTNTNINLGNSLVKLADATQEQIDDPNIIIDEYCTGNQNLQPDQIIPANCSQFGGQDPCICEIILVNPYGQADYYGYNSPINVLASGNVCARDKYGAGTVSCNPPDCPIEEVENITVNETISLRACTTSCSGSGVWACNATDCPTLNCNASADCATCCNLPNPLNLIATIKKSFKTSLLKSLNAIGYIEGIKSIGKNENLLLGQSDPCSDGLPIVTGCETADFVAFRYKVERHSCPPPFWTEAMCCTSCGCAKTCCQCVLRADAGYQYLVKEDQSYTLSFCGAKYPSTKEEIDPDTQEPTQVEDNFETNSFIIDLDPCLFSGLATAAEKIAKAQSLVSLTSTTVSVPCGQRDAYKLTICKTCIIMGGCSPAEVVSRINLCVGPFARATLLDQRGWLGPRIMATTQCDTSNPCNIPILGGSTLTLKNISVSGNNVSLLYGLSEGRVRLCATLKADVICNADDECGKGVTRNFRSSNGVSMAEWGFGSRWAMSPLNDGESPCFGQPDSFGFYETVSYSNCQYIDLTQQSCCSLGTQCAAESCDGKTPKQYCEKCLSPVIHNGCCEESSSFKCAQQGTPCPFGGICELISTPVNTPLCRPTIGNISVT